MHGGLISAWCDHFDLQVYTPNGCKETHSMAVEFTHDKEYFRKTKVNHLLELSFLVYPNKR